MSSLDGIVSGYAVRCFGGTSLSNSPGGRLSELAFLLAPVMEDGSIGPPMVSKREVLELLGIRPRQPVNRWRSFGDPWKWNAPRARA